MTLSSEGAGAAFVSACTAAGVDFYTGVPCSYLSGAFAAVAQHPHYVPAPREDLALGLAAGAWLGGRCPAVLMQNSGLGASLNALLSLLQLYRIPCLLVISWRGEPSASHADAPEHTATGAQLENLLRLAEVSFATLSRSEMHAEVAEQVRASLRAGRPAALLVRRGILEEPCPPAALPQPPQRVRATGSATGLRQNHAVQRLMKALPADAQVIASNGLLGREVFACGDRPGNFTMIGSMGLAAAIGAGLAHAQGSRPVVVLEGDGNTLMGLGALPIIGASQPRNLWHVVLNNGVHRSTGGQPSLACAVDFADLAAACGYAHATRSNADASVHNHAQAFFARAGPGLWELHCLAEATQAGRVSVSPPEMAARFRAAL